MDKITTKVDQAIKLLQAYNRQHNLVLAYSGGKDSDVCRVLCQLAHVPVDLVYNNTTIDRPHTIQRCIQFNAHIVRPKTPFLQRLAVRGLPSLKRRWCCAEFKERYIAPYAIFGIRATESVKRKKRYTEPTECKVYTKKKQSEYLYPILNWELSDVQAFVEDNNMTLHPHYYDGNVIDYNRRLGCIGCPLASDRGKRDFRQYPKFLRLWCQAYVKYCEKHGLKQYAYENIVFHLFYSNHKEQQFEQTFHGMFTPPDPKRIIEEQFGITL